MTTPSYPPYGAYLRYPPLPKGPWELNPWDQAGYGWRPVSPLEGGPERATERVPSTHHVDWAALYPDEIILSGPTNVKQVALTFDDGPDDVWTPQILNVLSANRVSGMFMCVGRRASENPQVLRRIVQEGHIVGNHTYSHPNLTKISVTQIRSQIQRTNQTIQTIAGVVPRFFRPPYGALSREVIQEVIRLNMKILFWNVDSLDWNGLTGPQVAANVLSHVRPGSIILMHSAGGAGESLADTVQALPYVIQVLKSEGYTFVTPPALIKETPYLTA